jgi:hypothetical protein
MLYSGEWYYYAMTFETRYKLYTNAALLNVQKPGEQPASGAAGGHALLHRKGKENVTFKL